MMSTEHAVSTLARLSWPTLDRYLSRLRAEYGRTLTLEELEDLQEREAHCIAARMRKRSRAHVMRRIR